MRNMFTSRRFEHNCWIRMWKTCTNVQHLIPKDSNTVQRVFRTHNAQRVCGRCLYYHWWCVWCTIGAHQPNSELDFFFFFWWTPQFRLRSKWFQNIIENSTTNVVWFEFSPKFLQFPLRSSCSLRIFNIFKCFPYLGWRNEIPNLSICYAVRWLFGSTKKKPKLREQLNMIDELTMHHNMICNDPMKFRSQFIFDSNLFPLEWFKMWNMFEITRFFPHFHLAIREPILNNYAWLWNHEAQMKKFILFFTNSDGTKKYIYIFKDRTVRNWL